MLAAMSIFAGCEKTGIYSTSTSPKTGPPTEPKSRFYAYRDNLLIGGYVYTMEGFEGKRPAIIFCTGLDASYAATEPYAIAAADLGYISCCFDFCGGLDNNMTSLSGGKKPDKSVLTVLLDLDAVYKVISAREDVDPDNVIVMGGSQGGLVAALYAARHPSDVRALGLLFPAFNLPDLVRNGVRDKIGDVNLNLIPDVFFPQEFEGHKFYKKYLVDAMTLYPFEEIDAFKGPVLIIHGDTDTIVPYSVSEQAAEIYDTAQYYLIPGQGHGFDAAGTAKAIEYLEDFLSDLIPGKPGAGKEVHGHPGRASRLI